jgi:hypothetical protein
MRRGCRAFRHCSPRQGCHRRATTFSSLMQFRAFAGPGVGRLLAEAMTNCLPWGKPVRAHLTGLVLSVILGIAAVSDAAHAQVPGVGPGHCVSGCGGGSSMGRSGGGGRGGGGFGGAGAIGSAIGIGMAIGSAVQQQQQQQAKEKSGARNKPEGESPRRVSHAREAKPERHKTDQADKPKEAKQPDTKQAKLTQPAKNSNWSGCTGKVGTTWNAGNCGHPTMPTTPTSSSGSPQFHKIPYFVPILPTRFVDALSCPPGFEKVGETFYGGTKCAPIRLAETQDQVVPSRSSSSERCGSIAFPCESQMRHVPNCGSPDGAIWVSLPNTNTDGFIKFAYIGKNAADVEMQQFAWREIAQRGADGSWKFVKEAVQPDGESDYLLTTNPNQRHYHWDIRDGAKQYAPRANTREGKEWLDRPGSFGQTYSETSDQLSRFHADTFFVVRQSGGKKVACAHVAWTRSWFLRKGVPEGNPQTSSPGMYYLPTNEIDANPSVDDQWKKLVDAVGKVPPPAAAEQ